MDSWFCERCEMRLTKKDLRFVSDKDQGAEIVYCADCAPVSKTESGTNFTRLQSGAPKLKLPKRNRLPARAHRQNSGRPTSWITSAAIVLLLLGAIGYLMSRTSPQGANHDIPLAPKAPEQSSTPVAEVRQAVKAASPSRAKKPSAPTNWSFEVNQSTGMLSGFKQGQDAWLSGEAQFRVMDEMNGQRSFPFSVKPVSSDAGVQSFAINGTELKGFIRYEKAADCLEVSMEVTYTGQKDFGATLSWVLPLSLSGKRMFATAETNHYDFDTMKSALELTYPKMAFPMWTAYADGKSGLSVIRDPAEAIPLQKFTVQKNGRLSMDAVNLWMKPNQPVRVSYFLAPHAGDWRCGLRWFTEHYRDWLTPSPSAIKFDGPMAHWRPVPDDELSDLVAQDLTWWEIHGTYEHLGKYVADHEPYYWAINDRLADLRRDNKPGKDVAELGDPDQTHDQVRDFIRRLHANNARGLMYWNQNDCWGEYSKKFEDCIIRDQAGKPMGDPNYLASTMAVNPANAWTSHIVGQLDGIIALYPKLDGIFNDQVCYFWNDFGRSDGITMQNGKPVANLRFGYINVARSIVPKLREKNLIFWANGGYTIDVARYYDGIMAEGPDTGMERTRYLGISGKPICMLTVPPDKDTVGGCETILKRALISGVQPSTIRQSHWPYPNDEAWKQNRPKTIEVFRKYQPLFRELRGKRWVLTEKAITTPPEMEGNLFLDPTDRGLATIVSFKSSLGDEGGELLQKKVSVHFDEPIYPAVYLTSPAWPGKLKINHVLSGDRYEITIPVHRSTTMLQFEKDDLHLSLEAESAIATDTGEIEVKAVLDNLTGTDVNGVLIVETESDKVQVACKAPAGGSAIVPVRLNISGPWAASAPHVPVHLAFSGSGQAFSGKSAILLRPNASVKKAIK